MSAWTPREGRRRLSERCHLFPERRRTRRGGGSGGRLRRRESRRLLGRRISRTALNNEIPVLLLRAGSGKLESFGRCLRRPSRAVAGNTILGMTFECQRSRIYRFGSRSALRRLRCPRSMLHLATFPLSTFPLSMSPTLRTTTISQSNLGLAHKFVRRWALRCSVMPVLHPFLVVS